MKRFARERFNSTDSTQLRRASFVLLEVPLAAIWPHLRRTERPPAIADELIRTTYVAIVGASPKSSARKPLASARFSHGVSAVRTL
jgi:hypothetical protein